MDNGDWCSYISGLCGMDPLLTLKINHMTRKRRVVPRSRVCTVMYRRSRDDIREYGRNKMTHSLIDTLFFETRSLQSRPAQDVIQRIYKVEGLDHLHMYQPSTRYLAFRRLQGMRERRRRAQ